MQEDALTALLTSHPDRGEIPIACAKAVCMAESSFDQYAYRYEQRYRWLVGDQETLTPTERAGQMSSWGLMQVMGGVAREDGFTGPFPLLCEPTVGLRYGLRHLRKFMQKYGDWKDAIASYNAGRPKKLPDGNYDNQSYVDKVLKLWTQYEKQIPLKESEV